MPSSRSPFGNIRRNRVLLDDPPPPLMEESLRRPTSSSSSEEEQALRRRDSADPPVRIVSRREAAPPSWMMGGGKKARSFRYLSLEDRQRCIDRQKALLGNRFPIQHPPQAATTSAATPPPPPPPAGFRFVTLEEDEEEDQIMSSQQHLARLDLSASQQFRFPWEAAAAAAAEGGSGGGGGGGYEEEEIKILSIDEISSKLGITEIRDGLVCSNCHQTSIIAFDLKCKDTAWYIRFCQMCLEEEEEDYRLYRIDRFLDPKLPPCPNCCSSNLKPLIPVNNNTEDYKRINWLFLFFGQMLGFCSVQQLDFFCKHSSSSTTTDAPTTTGGDCGDNNKLDLLYRTYLTLCKQLYPKARF